MNLVDPRGNFLQPGVQGHPECIRGWRKALQMGHVVLPWEPSPSILDRWLSPGLCLDTSKVEAPAAWPGRHSLPLLGSSRCGESPRSSYNSAPQGAQLRKCASNGPTPASWNLNSLVLDAPLEPGNTEASQAPGAPRPSPSRWGSRTFSTKPGPVDPSPGPEASAGRIHRRTVPGGRGGGCPNLFPGAAGDKGLSRRRTPLRCRLPLPLSSRPWGTPRRQVTGPQNPRGSEALRLRRGGPSHAGDRGARGLGPADLRRDPRSA